MNLTRRNFYAKRKPARVAPEFHLPASPCGKPGSCVLYVLCSLSQLQDIQIL